jgi:xanthine dehydrogenase YagS FAD-binding subunit
MVDTRPTSGADSPRRVEALAKVTGTAIYAADLSGDDVGGLLDHAVAVTSTQATVGKDGVVRVIPFEELHRLPERTPHLETTLRPADLITEFRVPASPSSWRSGYIKVRDRESYAFALASVAVAADISENGRVRDARIAIGGLATRPWRPHEAAAALQGRLLDEEAAAEAASIALAACTTDAQTAFKPELGQRILAQGLLAAAAMTPPAQRAV